KQPVPRSVLKAYGLKKLVFGPDYILPKPFDHRLLFNVSSAVAMAARQSGVATRPISDPKEYHDYLWALVDSGRHFICQVPRSESADDQVGVVMSF
ncbi:MAG: hypothetical protein NC102_08575, partial [Clostridium sp.]|nr:hypothetical protein [Clostridium sp.]